MRDIRPGRLLRPDGRLLSVRRVAQKPDIALIYRQVEGSTIDGANSGEPFLACTVTGRFDVYGIKRTGSSERHETEGKAAQMRYRFEISFPTDINGVNVDVDRGDHVIINGNEYRAIDLSYGEGYVEMLLDRWL